jgi:hypothetical protein
MTRVYVLCEGPTEEAFVNDLLSPMLQPGGIALVPIVCLTKRNKDGKKYTGGVSTYGKIHGELSKLCREHSNEIVTMMFDFYQLPDDTPGKGGIPDGSVFDKVLYLEEQIAQGIGSRNFIPNIILHEFEGLLFSSPEAFACCGLPDGSIVELQTIRDSHDSPEHIDDGITTAPSKRILKIHPAYRKLKDGVDVADEIGIDKIMDECRHFNGWVKKVMNLKA